MRIRSLRSRIVVFYVSLLVIVLSASFTLISASNLRISRAQATQDLKVGERVFRRLLEQNGRQLTQAASVLAADFAFREAIGTGDVGTIVSVLGNHGKRINAQVVMLSGLDNHLLADTLHPQIQHAPYPFPVLLERAKANGGANSIEVLDGHLYQLVVVPVKAPVLIAWVTIGFVIDDKTAQDLHALSALDVSFLSHQQTKWQLYSSTLPVRQRQVLLEKAATLPAPTLSLDDEEFQTLLLDLGTGTNGSLHALLQHSLQTSMAPFYALQRTLFILGAISLLVFFLVSFKLAGNITNPLRKLADAARKIKDGDYQQTIESHQDKEIGELAGSLAHMQEAIADREKRILLLAYQDTLTQLPNRARFNELLDNALLQAQGSGEHITVLLLDLDRFQQINDTLGHPVGDRVLQAVAQRLATALPNTCSLARLGGDEFAMFFRNTTVEQAQEQLVKIIAVFSQQIAMDDNRLDVSASIGIAAYPEHASNAIDLLRAADEAMYQAKKTHNPSAIFDPKLSTFRTEHLSLLGDLKHAVENNELMLYYQPKINLQTGRADEAEALVRWQHPRRGFIPPIEFIPFAEQTGYIHDLTRWVLASATQTGGQWLRDQRPIKISVNITTRDLLDPALPAYIAQCLQNANLPAELLCIEITESGFMDNPGHALEVLEYLRTTGLALSIDDYGTGYSSLAYLRKLPVTEIKIDRSFVVDMLVNPVDTMIVRSTIELSHQLGLIVVAEGIEDNATGQALAALGCDRAQGYFYAKPMAAAAFETWHQNQPH